MPLQGLVGPAVDEADQPIRLNGLLDLRGCGLNPRSLFDFSTAIRTIEAADCSVNVRDQRRQVGDRDMVVGNVCCDNIADLFNRTGINAILSSATFTTSTCFDTAAHVSI